MSRLLILFEDGHWSDLRPLTEVLPVPALAFGASSLGERWRRALGVPLLGFQARPYALAAWRDAPTSDGTRAVPGDDVVAINAAALPGPWLGRALEGRSPALWISADRIAGARLRYEQVAPGLGGGDGFERFLRERGLPEERVEASWLHWPWDFVERNPAALAEDLAGLRSEALGEVHPTAAILEPERVRIETGTRVDAYAVLDARGGPIHLREGAVVHSHTIVSGPCAVGPRTELLGGFIGNSTLGPDCRIAGEVDACIWQGYANKRHHGFVGHSVVGEWVNLGALTTTSDLKNNYGQVRVWAGGREIDSGISKVGSFLGAHVKTGIGSLLPTGASIGTGSNLVGGARFAPRHLPPFSWWDGEKTLEHRLEKFLETAQAAMSRRRQTLGPADHAALRRVFDAARHERT